MPLPVSCIITSFNNRRTITRAIRSVLAQTQPVAEIVVADDCSSDGSQELLLQLSKKVPTVRVILREENIGVSANRDDAIRSARCPFITHLDGDDLFLRKKIESEWRALGGDVSAVAFSKILRVKASAVKLGLVVDPRASVKGSPEQILRQFLSREFPIPRDMMFSNDLYLRAGGFEPGLNLYEDWQLKLKLACLAPNWKFSQTCGTVYFLNAASLSRASRAAHVAHKKRILLNNWLDFTKLLSEGECKSILRKIEEAPPPRVKLTRPARLMSYTRGCIELFRYCPEILASVLAYRNTVRRASA